METQLLLNFALALSLNELIHVIAESTNIRVKLKRLATYIAGKPYKELPVNINTRAKSYGISLFIFVVTVGFSYTFFLWLDLSLETGIKTIIALLVASYAITAVIIDQAHVDIEKITKPYKNKVTKGKK